MANEERDKRVEKLDEDTSTKIRKTQIITKISDVVRELIDNSVDAKANSVIVLLENFGVDKIEVRDSGDGISPADFQLAIAGGHTSKLKNDSHISAHKHYGFRGEALSSICSTAKVTISTKTSDEAEGRRYVLNQKGVIESEVKAAIGTGTTTTVKDLFCNIPVRRKYINEKTRKTAELKEIETFMRAMAIANFKIHFSLYHDGNLLWTKPSVTSMEQSLVTVLGVITAKKLTRYGPVDIFDDKSSENGGHILKRKGKMELFLPKQPVDYKTMSYTNNKMAMIFVNRRRVYIRECEKIIQRYVASVSSKPAPADNRRFPISVLSLDVPSTEVDFNRDMDKTKVFITCKEELSKKLEEILIKFYGVDLSNSDVIKDKQEGEKSMLKDDDLDKSDNLANSIKSCLPNEVEKPQRNETSTLITHPVLAASDDIKSPSRNENILAFLGNIPTACNTNFMLSPKKSSEILSENTPTKSQTHPATPISSSIINHTDFNKFMYTPIDVIPIDNQEKDVGGVQSAKKSTPVVSNFSLNLPIDSLDDSQPPPAKKIRNDEIDGEKWVQGRLSDKYGGFIENVAIVRGPLTTATKAPKPWLKNVTPTLNSSRCSSTTGLFDKSRSEATKRGGRTITLDAFRNWNLKTVSKQGSNLTTSSLAPIPFKPGTSETLLKTLGTTNVVDSGPELAIGVAPKSVTDYLEKSMYESQIVAGLTETVNSKNFFNPGGSSENNITSEEIRPLPKVVGELPKNLCIVNIDGYIGAFCPSTFLNNFPEVKTKYEANQKANDPLISTKEFVSSLLVDFVSALDVSEVAPEISQKIFHVLTDLDALNFQPPISSTQFSTM